MKVTREVEQLWFWKVLERCYVTKSSGGGSRACSVWFHRSLRGPLTCLRLSPSLLPCHDVIEAMEPLRRHAYPKTDTSSSDPNTRWMAAKRSGKRPDDRKRTSRGTTWLKYYWTHGNAVLLPPIFSPRRSLTSNFQKTQGTLRRTLRYASNRISVCCALKFCSFTVCTTHVNAWLPDNEVNSVVSGPRPPTGAKWSITVYKGPTTTNRGPKPEITVPPPLHFHFNHCMERHGHTGTRSGEEWRHCIAVKE